MYWLFGIIMSTKSFYLYYLSVRKMHENTNELKTNRVFKLFHIRDQVFSF